MNWKEIVIGVIIGAILSGVGIFFALSKKITKLETQIGYLEAHIEHPRSPSEEPSTSRNKANIQNTSDEDKIAIDNNIPLDAGWQPQGPGAKGGGYGKGRLSLITDLQGGDAYAELFLDLRAVHLSGIERNPDGSYNLAGREIIALVTSDKNFRGDPSHPNGAQFILKNEKWESLLGTWLNITAAMMTSEGMKIFYKVPDVQISRNVAGICLKFTIGSNSRETYKRSFVVHRVRVTK